MGFSPCGMHSGPLAHRQHGEGYGLQVKGTGFSPYITNPKN